MGSEGSVGQDEMLAGRDEEAGAAGRVERKAKRSVVLGKGSQS